MTFIEPQRLAPGDPAGRRSLPPHAPSGPLAGGGSNLVAAAQGAGARRRSLRVYLFGLVALVLIPPLALGGGIAWLVTRDLQRSFETHLAEVAEVTAIALERHIESRRVVLATLGQSATFDVPGGAMSPQLTRMANGVAEMLGEALAVFRPDGTPVFRTHESPGQELRQAVAGDAVARAVATQQTVVGNLFMEPHWVLPVMVPVTRGESVSAVLAIRLSRDALREVLAGVKPDSASFVNILDANGRIVARTPENANIGAVAPGWIRGMAAATPEGGIAMGRTLAGVETMAAVKPVRSAPGWAVVVAAPRADYANLHRRPLLWLLGGGLAAFGLATILTLLLSRRLLRPVRALTQHARHVASGAAEGRSPAGPFSVAELEALRTALAEAEAERRKVGEAQALLAREVDHRAKNVLAVVQSVLRMTRGRTVPEFVSSVTERVEALARAHSLLSSCGWEGGDMHAIAEGEVAAYTGPARVTLQGPSLHLDANAVQPVSMILHELATNAAKHGAISTPGGRVSLVWTLADDMLRLLWTETGGPELLKEPGHRGFGTRLVDATVVQLGGTASRHWAPTGFVFEARFPVARVLSTTSPARVGPLLGRVA